MNWSNEKAFEVIELEYSWITDIGIQYHKTNERNI